MTPCAVYIQNNPYSSSLNILYSWTFNLVTGLNQLFLTQPVTLNKGYLIKITQTTAKLAIDKSGGATYSDMYWSTSGIWSPLYSSSNWRFYLNLISIASLQYYQSQLNVIHTYSSLGVFNFSLSINNNVTYQELVSITDCKLNKYKWFNIFKFE